jgi:hypothetical protein
MVDYPISPGGYLVDFIIFSCFSEFLRLHNLPRLQFLLQNPIFFNIYFKYVLNYISLKPAIIQTSVTPLTNIKLKTL